MFGTEDHSATTAIYVRCHPRDDLQMEWHCRALHFLAHDLGLPVPLVFSDNGRRAADGLPRLDALLTHAAQGRIGIVLVPGPFVFSLDDRAAAEVTRRFQAHGCRVIDMPRRPRAALPTPG